MTDSPNTPKKLSELLYQAVAGDQPHLHIQINDHGAHLIAYGSQPETMEDDDGTEFISYDGIEIVAAVTAGSLEEGLDIMAEIIKAKIEM